MAFAVLQAVFSGSAGPVNVSFPTPSGAYGFGIPGIVITGGAPGNPPAISCDVPVPGTPNSTVNITASDAFTGVVYIPVIDLPNGPVVPNFTPGPLSKIFTSLPMPSGITASRASGDVWAQAGIGADAKFLSGATPVVEDKGDGAGYFLWASWPAFTNQLSPTDFSTGWSSSGTGTTTNNTATAPDGTATAAKINDTSAGAVYGISKVVTLNAPIQFVVWQKDDAGSPPSAPGMSYSDGLGFAAGSDAFVTPQSTWRRILHWIGADVTSSQSPNPAYAPAGLAPGPVATASATGAVNLARQQLATTGVDLPVGNGAIAAQVCQPLSGAELASLIIGGDLCRDIYFRNLNATILSQADGYIFSEASASGARSLRYVTATQSLVLSINGVDVLTCNMGLGPYGSETLVHIEYLPSRNTSMLRVHLNGAVQYSSIATGTTGGSGPLSAASSFYAGSNLGASGFWALPLTWIRTYSAPVAFSPEIVVAGDSICSWTTLNGLVNSILPSACIYTVAESRTRAGIMSLAVPGDKAEDQLSRLNAYAATLSSAQRNAVKGVLGQMMVNNIFSGGQSAAVATGHGQDYITAARAWFPNAKIVWCWMTPARAAFGSTVYAVWQAVNANISGSGANPLTGIDQVVTANSTNSDNGTGSLIAGDDVGDGIHETTFGKVNHMVPPWRAGLTAAGVLP